MGLPPIAVAFAALALGVAIFSLVVTLRATPQQLLRTLRGSHKDLEAALDRIDAIEQRFETQKVAVAEHLEAMGSLADTTIKERKRVEARHQRAEKKNGAAEDDSIAGLRARARAQGIDV